MVNFDGEGTFSTKCSAQSCFIKTRQPVTSSCWKCCFDPHPHSPSEILCLSAAVMASWNQSRKDSCHFQVSIASEKEFLHLGFSSVLEWLLASSNSERSSWGKGTLQNWKELYVQSSVFTSASTWNGLKNKTKEIGHKKYILKQIGERLTPHSKIKH